MKFGFRKPNFKKSLRARTTGKFKRSIKRAFVPGYGKKGIGILHPKRWLYNKVYRRTTFSLWHILNPFTWLKWLLLILFLPIVFFWKVFNKNK